MSLVAQPPAKTINLRLQAFGILLVGDVTPFSRLAPASMRGVRANLTVPSPPDPTLILPWLDVKLTEA